MKQKAIIIGPNGQRLDELNQLLEEKWKVVSVTGVGTDTSGAWLVVAEESPSSPLE